MSDLENLERRVSDVERRLDEALMNRVVREAGGEPEPLRRGRGNSARIYVGIVFLVLGLLWLGKNYGIDWLARVDVWPIIVIALGLLIIFGDRGR